ncbi:hypothetical protein TOK_2099 [Pseudonocardia sp. N23]|nr:hypothetical protein TOK_2099 [Pseudonocardia sp. N23]
MDPPVVTASRSVRLGVVDGQRSRSPADPSRAGRVNQY